MSPTNKVFIQEGTIVGHTEEGQWGAYEVSNCVGENQLEALANMIISLINQKGGEVKIFNYNDTLPIDVRKRIMELMGII